MSKLQDAAPLCLGVALMVCSSHTAAHSGSFDEGAKTSSTDAPADKVEPRMLDRIEARFQDETIEGILTAQYWTLIHCASGSEARKACAAIGMSETDREFWLKAAINRAGGVDAYRKNVSTLLKSNDEIVRSFGAKWLGALGDEKAVPD